MTFGVIGSLRVRAHRVVPVRRRRCRVRASSVPVAGAAFGVRYCCAMDKSTAHTMNWPLRGRRGARKG
jgi:hypothetical protein